ncbi:MAG: VCBS repeat-containing protein [Bacteroidia bacterium]
MSIVLAFILSFNFALAQNFQPANIPVIQNGKTLESAFAGGLNQPQFSQIHLNGDTLPDLFVFDRSDERVLCFHAIADANGKIRYRYAPEDAALFPAGMEHWAILADYNCDGLPDLFTSSFGFGGIAVFENTGSQGNPTFSLAASFLQDLSSNQPIYADTRDLPAFIDVDDDGDLDILAFESGGFSVNWFQNRAIEDSGSCGPLAFHLNTACWGHFQEDGLTNTVTLHTACKRDGPKHAGSTLCAFDEDGDGNKDVLIGDLNFNNLVYLHNGGTLNDADMDLSIFNYPAAAPVSIHIFPSAFWLDVDLDGRKDLIASTNAKNVGANYDQVWLYRNDGTGPAVSWTFTGKSFLIDEMIEAGSYSKPAFFDENGDGLLDLLIGNYLYRNNKDDRLVAFTLYHNTGTATAPAFSLSDRNYLDISNIIQSTDSDVAPAFADLDGDGDQDLCVGTFSGKLYYFQNNPLPNGQANFSFSPALFQNIDVGQHAHPAFGDVDGDGDPDMVVGENGGTLNLFINNGNAQNPVFASLPDDDFWGEIDVRFGGLSGYSAPFLLTQNGGWDLIVGTESGILMRYRVAASGPFSLLDSAWGGVHTGIRCTPALADLNGDGRAELAAGGRRGGIGMFESPLMVSNDVLVQSEADWQIQYGKTDRLVTEKKGWKQAKICVIDLQGRVLLEGLIREGDIFEFDKWEQKGILYVNIQTANGSHSGLKYLSQ